MAELAQKPLTFNEFLDWDDGSDARYEFVDGQVVAMAPPTIRHGRLAQRVGDLVSRNLPNPGPCYVVHQTGIKVPRGQASDFYVADLAVSCEPDDTAHFVSAPKLVIEILSPRTETFDLTRRSPITAIYPASRKSGSSRLNRKRSLPGSVSKAAGSAASPTVPARQLRATISMQT